MKQVTQPYTSTGLLPYTLINKVRNMETTVATVCVLFVTKTAHIRQYFIKNYLYIIEQIKSSL